MCLMKLKIPVFVIYIRLANEKAMDTVLNNTQSIDYSKVERVKRLKRNKHIIWISFLLFGWSYGSLGKLGHQAIWYGLSLFTIFNLIITWETSIFDEYSAMAIVGLFLLIVWFIIRLFTLNRDIKKYNLGLADHFYLTPEERVEAGIE